MIGSFIVLLVLVYFLYPILKPNKAKSVNNQEHLKAKMATFDPVQYNPSPVDSLQRQTINYQTKIDSLTKSNKYKQQLIDSLRQALKNTKESMKKLSAYKQQHAVSAKEASKSLLNLRENSLGPIVNLLSKNQLISLYKDATDQQRQKLLRTLKPQKAAAILKEVMK